MASPNEKLRVLRRIPEIRFDEEMRGYNKNQVDRVLENLAPLADEVDVLLERLSEAERRAASAEARLVERTGAAPAPAAAPAPTISPADFDETLSKTLLLAQRTADATVNEANEEAVRIRNEAQVEAADARNKAAAESASSREEIERDRASVISRANAEASTMVDAARSTIEAKIREAEQELVEAHESTRADLLAQIAELQRSRDALAVDVDHFEGHLATRRETIREALAELSAVIDDPDRLRTTMPPTPIAVADHDPSAYPPIKVEVNTLDTLAAEVEVDSGSSLDSVDDSVEDDANDEDDEDDANDDVVAAETGASGVLWADSGSASDHDAAGGATAGGAADAYTAGGFTPGDFEDSAGEPTAAFSVADEAEAADRPDWADAVPPVDEPEDVEPDGSDPFLDELRRVTSDDDDEDEALSSFLSESDEGDSKGGWFGRRK